MDDEGAEAGKGGQIGHVIVHQRDVRVADVGKSDWWSGSADMVEGLAVRAEVEAEGVPGEGVVAVGAVEVADEAEGAGVGGEGCVAVDRAAVFDV